jgi:hypothetical protein
MLIRHKLVLFNFFEVESYTGHKFTLGNIL